MHEPPGERRAWSRWEVLLLVAALAPPAFLLATVLRLGVDTPYMDQWEVAPLFAKWHDGTLGFGDLWAQQNESRMVVPRLLFLGLGLLTGWNLVAETIPALLLAGFCSWAAWALDRRTLGGPRAAALGRLAIANLLLFGPIQYENWLWGHQAAVYLPPACLLAGLLVATSGASVRTRAIVAALLCVVATLSFANGMILWLLLAPAALPADPGGVGPGRMGRAAWAAVALAAVGLYMAGYEKPAAQPGFAEALRDPVRAAGYLAALLGSSLGQGIGHTGIEASASFGALLLVLAAAVVVVARRAAEPEDRRRTLPWMLLLAYGLGTALVTTVGRSGFGVPHALSPRYAPMSAISWAALAYLAAAFPPGVLRRRLPGLTEARAAAAAGILATVVVAAHLLASQVALVRMENWRVRRLEARACLAFLEVAPNEPFLRRNCYPFLEKLRERAPAVDRLGLLRPALVKPGGVAEVLGIAPDPAFGKFHAFAASGDAIRCRGTAAIPARGEAPDAILVGWLEEGGARGVVAVAQAGRKPLSNRTPPSADFERTTDWECRVPLDAIPPAVRALRAWAYDTTTGRATLLPGTAAIPGR